MFGKARFVKIGRRGSQISSKQAAGGLSTQQRLALLKAKKMRHKSVMEPVHEDENAEKPFVHEVFQRTSLELS